MCGIAGFVGEIEDDRRALLERMTRAVAHRGPDDEGLFDDGLCALGHRRLSIIDLSSAGHEPMSNEDGTIVLVFNGEVYNFRSLRKTLSSRHKFSSATDAEVVIHLYEEHGDDAVNMLEGMFAFALWDRRRRRLLLARDPFGIKPLVYAETPCVLAFASELSALRGFPWLDTQTEPGALASFLALRYVAEPQTMWSGAHRLRAGHVLVWESGRLSERKYWEPPVAHPMRLSVDDAAREFGRVFVPIVREQMTADVPLGALLSGGLDSTAVVTAMARAASGPVHTFTIGFGGRSGTHDECAASRLTAVRLGVEHHEITSDGPDDRLIHELLDSFDEPYANSTAIPSYILSKFTRGHVKVALSGVGGDELFGGYLRLRLVRCAELLRASRLDRLASLILGTTPFHAARIVGRNVSRSDWSCAIHVEALDGLTGGQLQRLAPSLLRGDEARIFGEVWRPLAGEPSWSASRRGDLASYLPGDLLGYVDHTSMRFALEVRVPFIDRRLVEFANRLPARLVAGWRSFKPVIRRWLAGKVPDNVVRRPKAGFPHPLGRWLKGPLREAIISVASESALATSGIIDPQGYRSFVDGFLAGRVRPEIMWTLYVLAAWVVKNNASIKR